MITEFFAVAGNIVVAGPISTRLLEAFRIVLKDTGDRRHWIASTKQLQLASFELCKECRDFPTLHLRVDEDTPRALLGAADAPDPNPGDAPGEGGSPRSLPRVRARGVTWKLASTVRLSRPLYALAKAEVMVFGWVFDDGPGAIVWPRRLTSAIFGTRIYEAIDTVAWSASLQRIAFGYDFNQSINGISWPSSLRELSLGGFDQDIEGAQWPASLKTLKFGLFFNQPVAGVRFPASLRQLIFGRNFNHGVVGLAWPAHLQSVEFGERFNKPVGGIQWPSSLTSVTFGSNFNQKIAEAGWPASMKRLALGRHFNLSIDAIGTWIPGLTELCMLVQREKYSHPLADVQWPKGLQTLRLDQSWQRVGVAVAQGCEVVYDSRG